MMKIKGMEAPRNILFSGTGSKTLNIIDSDKNLGALTKLFEAIFNEVYGNNDSIVWDLDNPADVEGLKAEKLVL